MGDYEDVVLGQHGFTYDLKALDERGIVDIRDPQDELFAQVEYTPETGDYIIEIDGGYGTWQDFEHSGLADKMEVHETNTPDPDQMIGRFRRDEIDEWRTVTYATLEEKGTTLEVENIKDDDIKTLIRLISNDGDLSSPAETLVNRFRPPFIQGERDDPYGETWAPYSNARKIRLEPEDRESTVEEVFDTAIRLTEDLLEKKQRSKD